MVTVHKSDLITQVSLRMKVSKNRAAEAVWAVTESIEEELADHGRVTIVNFGSFVTRPVQERRVLAIGGEQAGSSISVPEHNRVRFRPSPNLNRSVQPGGEGNDLNNNAALTRRVVRKLGISTAQAAVAVTSVLETVKASLAKGDRVVLTNFGSFEVRQIKTRRIHPIRGSAGASVTVPAHTRVGFRPGAGLIKSVAPEWYERLFQRGRRLFREIRGSS